MTGDILITVLCSIISTANIINHSARKLHYRIRIEVVVSYDSDLCQVEKIQIKVPTKNHTLEKTGTWVRVLCFAESSIRFQLLVRIHEPRQRGRETLNQLKTIHIAYQEQEIEIPFPR